MRFVIDSAAPGYRLWHHLWDDRPVAGSPESYGSEAAAEAVARAFQRGVAAAALAVPA